MMTTLVGTQSTFADVLYALCELDYDAVEAYQAAINRLENPIYKAKLESFKQDHERHIQEISALLRKHQGKVPEGPCPKNILTQGKVVLANLFGDNAILKAMLSNEEDTNTAYTRVSDRTDQWEDALVIIQRGLQDEKSHKAWIENTLEEKITVD